MLNDWLKLALPSGNGDLILYSLHADESYSGNTGRMIVAGYLIGSEALVRFTDAWSKALGPLEYFHMSDGHHKTHPDVYARLVSLISHKYITAGFSASVDQSEYRLVARQRFNGQPLQYWFGGPYSFCVGAVANLANRWLDYNNPREQHVAYVFEAGGRDAGTADMFLHRINSDPLLVEAKRSLRYYSHTFLGKHRDAGCLQAADILAWHLHSMHRTGRLDSIGGALIEAVDTREVHYSQDAIVETLQAQLEFCDFYGELRRAVVLRHHA